jgi:hypothetical protein
MNPFVERHHDEISGVLPCFDRVIITGTLPEIAYAEAMARYLSAREMRLFDYTHWAEPLCDELRRHTEALAEEAGLQIEFIRRHKAFRKEQRVKAILAERGDHPGLVHIFSAMESCSAYRPWHDKKNHTTGLKSVSGKCLHYYFYYLDELFGLCCLRVPTWAPFRLQAYFNGHHWLARRLAKAKIDFEMADNAFVRRLDEKFLCLFAQDFSNKGVSSRMFTSCFASWVGPSSLLEAISSSKLNLHADP